LLPALEPLDPCPDEVRGGGVIGGDVVDEFNCCVGDSLSVFTCTTCFVFGFLLDFGGVGVMTLLWVLLFRSVLAPCLSVLEDSSSWDSAVNEKTKKI